MTRHHDATATVLPLLCALLLGGVVAGCAGEAEPDEAPAMDAVAAPAEAPAEPLDAPLQPIEPTPAEAPDDATPPVGADTPSPTIGRSSADATRSDGSALLRDVRTGDHAGMDRVTFEFEGTGLPAWEAEYVDQPVRDCGSGDAVPVAGDGWLEIRFVGARAHTTEGVPTAGPRRRQLDHSVMRELVRTCDFEGHVTYVVGVGSPNAYTPRVMASPSRLVIDIAH